jgi:excisionase family DNA binding protein
MDDTRSCLPAVHSHARLMTAAFAGNRKYATPRQIAKLLEVGEDTVLGWIKAGILPAVDHRGVGSPRPRWKITRDHVDTFERRRTVAASEENGARVLRPSKRSMVARDWFPEG